MTERKPVCDGCRHLGNRPAPGVTSSYAGRCLWGGALPAWMKTGGHDSDRWIWVGQGATLSSCATFEPIEGPPS